MKTAIITVATGLNRSKGGINSFNFDLVTWLIKESSSTNLDIYLLEMPDKKKEVDSKQNKVLVNGLQFKKIEIKNSDIETSTEVIDAKLLISNYHICNFIAHDILTGPYTLEIINALNEEFKIKEKKIVLTTFHHMDYESYQSNKKENGEESVDNYLKQKDVFNNSDICIGVGPKLTSNLSNLVLKPKIHELLPGIVENAPYSPKNDSSKLKLICFGRFTEEDDIIKNLKTTIAAFGDFTKRNRAALIGKDLTLTIYGANDTDKNQLQSLIQKYSDNIRITINHLNYTEDRDILLSHLSTHDAAILPSLHEGFGLVGLEIISCKIPLLLSTNSGLYSFIEKYIGLKGVGCLVPIDIKGLTTTSFSKSNRSHQKNLQVVNDSEVVSHENIEVNQINNDDVTNISNALQTVLINKKNEYLLAASDLYNFCSHFKWDYAAHLYLEFLENYSSKILSVEIKLNKDIDYPDANKFEKNINEKDIRDSILKLFKGITSWAQKGHPKSILKRLLAEYFYICATNPNNIYKHFNKDDICDLILKTDQIIRRNISNNFESNINSLENNEFKKLTFLILASAIYNDTGNFIRSDECIGEIENALLKHEADKRISKSEINSILKLIGEYSSINDLKNSFFKYRKSA